MSAPVISLITNDTPRDGRDKINASLTSLKDNTVWLDPMSTQNGVFRVVAGLFSQYVSFGTSPAAAGAVRLENTAEMRWAYSGVDTWRMRNNGNAWDLSWYLAGTWYPVFQIAASVVGMPNPVSFGAQATFTEITEPGAPLAGGSVYANGGVLYYKNAAGTVYNLTTGATLFSRGSGYADPATVAEGSIRYDDDTDTLSINVNGAWREL